MDKKEMKEILFDALAEKEKNMEEYKKVMMKILPEYMETTPEERLNKHFEKFDDDTKSFIMQFEQEQPEYIDFNNPDKSIMTIIYDFIYGDKPNLTKKEKKFLKNFDNILSLIQTCQYALGIKEDSGVGITHFGLDKTLFDSDTLHVENEDIIITDPCYIGHNRGYDLDHIHHSTIYGDWGCNVVNEDTGEMLGTFCADAGEVGIFKLEEVKKKYPKYNYIESYPHTVTVIKNFTGDVTIKVGFDKKHKDFYCYVEGKGSINFKSYQNRF